MVSYILKQFIRIDGVTPQSNIKQKSQREREREREGELNNEYDALPQHAPGCIKTHLHIFSLLDF